MMFSQPLGIALLGIESPIPFILVLVVPLVSPVLVVLPYSVITVIIGVTSLLVVLNVP